MIHAGGFMTSRLEIEIDGEKHTVIPRDYQLDPVRDRPLHVDFLRLKAGQKIAVEIPIHVVGQDNSIGVKAGGAVNVVRHAVALSVAADAIPEGVEVDVSEMAIGDTVHVSDLKLPRGARLANAADAAFAVVTLAPPAAEEPAAEAPAGATPSAGAEAG